MASCPTPRSTGRRRVQPVVGFRASCLLRGRRLRVGMRQGPMRRRRGGRGRRRLCLRASRLGHGRVLGSQSLGSAGGWDDGRSPFARQNSWLGRCRRACARQIPLLRTPRLGGGRLRGLRRLWAARRRDARGSRHHGAGRGAGGCGGGHERWGSKLCRPPRLRASSPGDGRLLGLEHRGPSRRRNENRAACACRGVWAQGGRADLRQRGLHLRASRVWHRRVLGVQLARRSGRPHASFP